ncbi:hypothetical protein KBT16_07460 [Nostoc sp. CCCryo 231-06]|nr:hypothetical protein [Nostoc sp. CCCryo 231-06]
MAYNLVERSHFGCQGENDYLCGIGNWTAIFAFTVLWLETFSGKCLNLRVKSQSVS